MSTHAKALDRSSTAPIVRGAMRSTSLREARPAPPGPQPGDVRRAGRQRPHDAALVQALLGARRGAGRLHPRGRRSGSGSRCCSPTSPRRWPRAAARRRPTRCGGARRDVVREEARRRGPIDPKRALRRRHERRRCARATSCWSRPGDDRSPATARSIEGVASVDESAITGESAPVIREAAATAARSPAARACSPTGSSCASRADPGETFLDRMIAHGRGREAPEDAERDRARHPARRRSRSSSCSRRATLLPFSIYAVNAAGQGAPVTVTVLVALLVCLIPTTIGGLLSAIGIAGMDRMIQANVIAMSGRAVEAAGDVDVLLLDKTGTITLGNRQATAFIPRRRRERRASSPTPRSSPRSPTRRPRAAASSCSPRSSYGLRERDVHALGAHVRAVHRADAHERRRPRRARRSARARPTRSRRYVQRARAARFPAEVRASGRRGVAPRRRHAARGRRGRATCSA